MLVQHRRNCRAALRLMRKLLKQQGFAPKLQAALLGGLIPARLTATAEQERAPPNFGHGLVGALRCAAAVARGQACCAIAAVVGRRRVASGTRMPAIVTIAPITSIGIR